MRGRRAVALAVIALGLAGCDLAAGLIPAPRPLLGSTWSELGQGHYLVEGPVVTDDLTWGTPNDTGADLVIEGVSLIDPSPGLTYLGAVIFPEIPKDIEPHVSGFPAPSDVPSVPAVGYHVPAGGQISLGLGLRIDDPAEVNGFDAVLIDYSIDGQPYETTLHYRSVLCPPPVVEGRTCQVPDERSGLPWITASPSPG